MSLNATILPTSWSTRILVTDHGKDLLKARLPTGPQHPRALVTLLEGLALWTGSPVHAVLVAEGLLGATHVGGLFEDFLPIGTSNVEFDIVNPHEYTRLAGPGCFRRLRTLHGRVR